MSQLPTGCGLIYLGECCWCLENRIKECSSHVTTVICQQCVKNPKANISYFKITDQDGKQVVRKVREAIHIRINNPAINYNIGKMNIPEIFNNLLGTDRSSNESDSMGDLDHPQSHIHLIFQVTSLQEQCVWQIR